MTGWIHQRQTAVSWRLEALRRLVLNYQASSVELQMTLFWTTQSELSNLKRLGLYRPSDALSDYLYVRLHSVPMDATFSTTGLILSSKRASLNSSKLKYCTFIHNCGIYN